MPHQVGGSQSEEEMLEELTERVRSRRKPKRPSVFRVDSKVRTGPSRRKPERPSILRVDSKVRTAPFLLPIQG